MDAFSRFFRPSAPLADVVEAIWNWEIADPAAARRAISITLPSPFPILSVHYGEPMWSDRPRGSGYYMQIATGIQTGVVKFRPSGPAGCVLVRLKPEATARIMGAEIRDFTDTNVLLEDIFGSDEIGLLQDALSPRATAALGSRASRPFSCATCGTIARIRSPRRPRCYCAGIQACRCRSWRGS